MSRGVDAEPKSTEKFFPFFVIKDFSLWGIAFMVLFVVALCLPFESFYAYPLFEPFDPKGSTPEGIKPEWYFLSTYQLLKYFPKLLGILVSMLPPLVLLLIPFLDRSPERHPKRRPVCITLGVVTLILAIAFGVIGHLSETTITFQGRKYHIDMYGVPHPAPPAPVPGSPPPARPAD
jgi:quinol-cytochrome oxidoreductase complex cytochrome b subunit